jgi:putative zinc finger/helix-turn-helix YgiT family protein
MNRNENFNKGRIAMQTVAFGYKCQECGQGTVLEKIFHEYHTKLKGYPLTVDNARIGVCDRCGAQHFDPNETARWRALLEEKQAESYLQPSDIRDLRKQLGLTMEQFAVLLGSTRQSLYNWERSDRPSPQSRMADLFMRLIHESHLVGQINVLSFLTAEATKLGFQLTVSPKAKPIAPILAIARKTSFKSLMSEASEPLKLAAETETATETVVLVTEHNQPIARLFHDYASATLNLAFVRTVPFTEFDAEIHFKDGTQTTGKHLKIRDQEVMLLNKTTLTEEDVDHVVLSPQELLTTSK